MEPSVSLSARSARSAPRAVADAKGTDANRIVPHVPASSIQIGSSWTTPVDASRSRHRAEASARRSITSQT
jgi:hypothetical protein